MRECVTRSLLAVTVCVLIPAWGFAHAIGVDCTVRGARVEVEAYYDDDTPAIKAKVQVVGARDEIVAAGSTDDKGQWSFAAPAPGTYEIRVDAGGGHRKTRILEVPAASAGDAPSSAPQGVPNRHEFTHTPWLKVVVGLCLIAGISAAFLLFSWLRRKVSSGAAADRAERI